MGDPTAQIEAKLNKSLEDLIKEQQQSSRGGRGGGRGGSDRGRSGGRGQKRRSKQNDDDAMETEDAGGRSGRRVDTSALRTRGGISKTQSRGRGLRGNAEGVPKGNVNKQWTHDQYNDDGPAKPRKVAGGPQRQRAQQPVANMSVVRITNLPRHATQADMMELLGMVDKPVSITLSYADDGTRNCEAYMRSEDAAREVQERYTECALDGQALRVTLGGTMQKTTLRSGLAVEKVRSAPGGGAAALHGVGGASGGGGGGGGKPRGRGAQRGGQMYAYA